MRGARMMKWLWNCGAALGLLGLAGCGGLGSFLNPDFLTAVGLRQQAATLPGESPLVLVEVENRTARRVIAKLSVRTEADGVLQRNLDIPAGDTIGEAFICPVTEMTLGDVGDLDAIGATVRLGDETNLDPVIEVEPFGVILENSVNFDCGDRVTFAVQTSGATLSGYQIFAYVRRSGANVVSLP